MKVRIGIDPDIEKSGVCQIEERKITKLETLDFFDLTKKLSLWNGISELLVCIESGWLNKKVMFHMKEDKFGNKSEFNKGTSAKIAMYTGQNHAVGKLIEQYCIKNDIPYKLVTPTGKKWDAKLFKSITKYEGKSNPETRDACRAAWI